MQDSYGRICSCIRILSDGGFLSRKHNGADEAEAEEEAAEEEEDGAATTTTTTTKTSKPRQASFIRELYLQFCRDSFSDMLRQKQKEDAEKKKEKDEQVSVQADDLLVMRQLRANRVVGMRFFSLSLSLSFLFLFAQADRCGRAQELMRPTTWRTISAR